MKKMTAPPKRMMVKPPSNQQSRNTVSFSSLSGGGKRGHRVVLYGTGGIGKTTLACLAPGPVAFIDIDESIPILESQLKLSGIPVPVGPSPKDWKELRACLQGSGWDKIKTVVIDSITGCEAWCISHTLQTVKHEKGHIVQDIEGYGYGKGYQHVFDVFLTLLSDLDRHVREGRNVILIAHECSTNVPNPRGEDWLRYEPRLQSPNSGKASIRHRVKEWADHVLFLAYDVVVDKEGKAQGQGTRSLYTSELPFCMAKSRTTGDVFDIELGETPWEDILK